MKANLTFGRSYSTSSCPKIDTPMSVLTVPNLQDKENILSKCNFLLRKGGIYSFFKCD